MAWLAGDRESGPPVVRRAAEPQVTSDDPGARASDADRDQVITELGEGFAQGRLSHETFVFRVDAALRARRQHELDDQVADLRGTRRRGRPALAPSLRKRVRELSQTVQATVASWGRYAPPALVLPTGPARRYTIGREWACDMSISDMTVSRWHADLRLAPGGWRLADLGSLNGTRLNGWRITEPVPVQPGDLVSFGTATFVLAEVPPAVR
jgi:hypothetical protein